MFHGAPCQDLETPSAESSPFAPLFVKKKVRKAFKGEFSRQEEAVMDRREENALNEVDRITLAVERLRDLLLAATTAELRAKSKQRTAQAPPS
jgi:hypothetical protein